MADMKKPHAGPSGIFIIDLQSLRLSVEQFHKIDLALQETVQREIAKLDDTEGIAGGPIVGVAGFAVRYG